MDINELVKKAQSGDQQAFGQIYDEFAQRLFKFIRLKIQDRQEAEDVLQETFVKAYQGLGQLKLDKLNFSAWIYKITSNTINDHFRKHYRTPEILEIDEQFDLPKNERSLEEQLSIQTDLETVRAALNRLPPLYKQVLELRFIQDFSLNEVAAIMGKSNLAVRLLQFRALKKVQLILRQKYDLGYEKI